MFCHSISYRNQFWDHKWGLLKLLHLLRPNQNGRLFASDIFKCILLKETLWIAFNISLKWGWINKIPTLVRVMAWSRPGYKPVFEPNIFTSLTHIRVTRPPLVNVSVIKFLKYMQGYFNYFHIWRVLPQQSGSDTCRIWMWLLIGNQWFDNGELSGKQQNRGNLVSNPHSTLDVIARESIFLCLWVLIAMYGGVHIYWF